MKAKINDIRQRFAQSFHFKTKFHPNLRFSLENLFVNQYFMARAGLRAGRGAELSVTFSDLADVGREGWGPHQCWLRRELDMTAKTNYLIWLYGDSGGLCRRFSLRDENCMQAPVF